MEIKLENEQLKQALDAAIMGAIGETGREQIIRECVRGLTERTGYDKRSRLEQIMVTAAERVACAIIEEKMGGDSEFREQIDKLYAEALAKVFEPEFREELVGKLASSISEVISTLRSRY